MTEKPSIKQALAGFGQIKTGPHRGMLPDAWENASGSIRPSAEFTRIFNLPRKTAYDWTAIAEELTLQLKTPEGDWHLRPIQAEVILAVSEHEGCFASVGVGGGKTLMSYLAGTVSDARLVVVIVPAKLREKTRRDFAELRKRFICTSRIEIISAEEMGLKDGLQRLTRHGDPDLIVIDECHKFKNRNAARTRKLLRYLKERRERGRAAKLLAMSGTITSKSLRDFAHLIEEALGPFDSPLPIDVKELGRWSRLVDPDVQSRVRPGPFIKKLPENVDFRTAKPDDYRKVVHHRIFDTPGAVKLPSAAYGGPIEISFIDPKLPTQITDLLDRLIEGKIQPNGDECYPGDIYRHTRCLCLGFWYDWEPPPPEHWRQARRSWRSYCRTVLEAQIPGLDSELMVINAVDRGWYVAPGGDRDNPADRLPIDDGGVLEHWRKTKPDYDGVQVARWVTDDILNEIMAAAKVVDEPQLVWTEFAAVGEWLERRGLPYYRNKGMTRHKDHIMDCPGHVSPVLSLGANTEGLNLQDRWFRALYLTPMQSTEAWEQSIGRIHRPGQLEDQIEIQIVAGHPKLYEAFDTALERTRYVQQMQGAPQKLLLADIVR